MYMLIKLTTESTINKSYKRNISEITLLWLLSFDEIWYNTYLG